MLLEWKYWIYWSVTDPAPPAKPARISNCSNQIAEALGPSLDLLLVLGLRVAVVVMSHVTELGTYDQSSATMKRRRRVFLKQALGRVGHGCMCMCLCLHG